MTLRYLKIMNEWFRTLKNQNSLSFKTHFGVWECPRHYRVYHLYDDLLATSYGRRRKSSPIVLVVKLVEPAVELGIAFGRHNIEAAHHLYHTHRYIYT